MIRAAFVNGEHTQKKTSSNTTFAQNKKQQNETKRRETARSGIYFVLTLEEAGDVVVGDDDPSRPRRLRLANLIREVTAASGLGPQSSSVRTTTPRTTRCYFYV